MLKSGIILISCGNEKVFLWRAYIDIYFWLKDKGDKPYATLFGLSGHQEAHSG